MLQAHNQSVFFGDNLRRTDTYVYTHGFEYGVDIGSDGRRTVRTADFYHFGIVERQKRHQDIGESFFLPFRKGDSRACRILPLASGCAERTCNAAEEVYNLIVFDERDYIFNRLVYIVCLNLHFKAA